MSSPPLPRARWARDLAEELRESPRPPDFRSFKRRLAAAGDTLHELRQSLAATPPSEIRSGAAEWLTGNEHIVLDALDRVRTELPRRFFTDLPAVQGGTFADQPRTLALVTETVARTGAEIDLERMVAVAREFQRVSVLRIGELWALANLLRFALLETLAHSAREALEAAPPGQAGRTEAHQRVAAAITSLRLLGVEDWTRFFETVSVVEQILRKGDPPGVYARMDAETRDRYRKCVERAARRLRLSEPDVASAAVEAALEGGVHVGHALVGGLEAVATILGARRPWLARLGTQGKRVGGSLYFLGVGLGSALAWAAIIWPVLGRGTDGWGMALGVLAIVPALTVAVAVANWFATHVVGPTKLPKLDFADGIPREWRTLVAVPALLDDPGVVEELTWNLEVNHLANQDPQVVFALLTDFGDAPEPSIPSDAPLLASMRRAVRALNDRYGDRKGEGPFLLLHRPRRWCTVQRCWMGWERKRGKLEELNRLLLADGEVDLAVREGDARVLDGIRFVITLDADTTLPPGTAHRLAGALAHPLNRPAFATDGRITAGYTVIQPRVETLPAEAGTRFERVQAGDSGLDLYSGAVSDVYQDLFGEGIFAGKGIYDVEAFHRSLLGRVPDDTLLSHDLFEGLHGRAGLASDITVFEEYPPDLLAHSRRLHRWIRGDWQILPWLAPVVPLSRGVGRNRISLLGRWKIADNLRRSLTYPSALALLVTGWLTPATPGWWWSAVTLAVLGMPVVAGAATAVRARARFPGRRAHFSGLRMSPPAAILQWMVGVAYLPYNARVDLDAIVRTLWRLLISRRNLLEWTTASNAARMIRGRGRRFFALHMLSQPLAGLAGLLILAWLAPSRLPAAAPILLLWIPAPWVAWWLANPLPAPESALGDDDRRKLLVLARRTWGYFDRHSGPDDHWLPPDNFQESPLGVVAHRTSPTNVGFLMVSTLAAHDLGFIGIRSMVARLANTVDALEELERHRGHLLNWYDTRTLHPLPPLYVSTVDSGNLAAALLTLSAGLEEAASAPLDRAWHRGITATVLLLLELSDELCPGSPPPEMSRWKAELERLIPERSVSPATPAGKVTQDLSRAGAQALEGLEDTAEAVLTIAESMADPSTLGDLRYWVGALRRQAEDLREERARFQPWTLNGSAWSPPTPELSPLSAALPERPSLEELARLDSSLGPLLESLLDGLPAKEEGTDAGPRLWLESRAREIREVSAEARTALEQLDRLGRWAEAWVDGMDFSFLFDVRRSLFHIGYNISNGTLDSSFYDLFASEARLASFVAIAKGDAPARHWMHLGRPFGRTAGGAVLLSWAGTGFEYLMPTLFLRSPEDSLGHRACRGAVARQRAYGNRFRTPWGVSESAYADTDAGSVYQYRAFGVPDLGLHREFGDRLVVSPYASALALRFDPRSVLENFESLAREDMLGALGFFDALDYGRPGRMAVGRPSPVRTYMAHHQGMILVALTNALTADRMIRRFHSNPPVAAAEFLLFEQAPRRVRLEARERQRLVPPRMGAGPPLVEPWRVDPEARPTPMHVLSNGTLLTRIDARGGGGLSWNDFALTRWRSGAQTGQWGCRLWIRDQESGEAWSVTADPPTEHPSTGPTTLPPAATVEVTFSPHMVEMVRERSGIWSHLAVTVAPSADVEIRLLTLTNAGRETRRLMVASYGEVALAEAAEDRRHPAFARLFVEEGCVARSELLCFNRRTADPDKAVALAHGLVRGERSTLLGGWNDRQRFLGRERGKCPPPGLEHAPMPLTELGSRQSLDSIFSLACEVEIPPGEQVELAFLTGASRSRGRTVQSLEAFRSIQRARAAFDQAQLHSQVQLQSLGLDPVAFPNYQRLISAILSPFHDASHASAEELANPAAGAGEGGSDSPLAVLEDAPSPPLSVQESLWSLGISGDLPILLLRVARTDETPPILEALRVHSYWEGLGVEIDLVIQDEEPGGYAQTLRHWLIRTLNRMGRGSRLGQPGGIHYMAADQLEARIRADLRSSAAVILRTDRGSIADQLDRLEYRDPDMPPFVPVSAAGVRRPSLPPVSRAEDVGHRTALGGFSRSGRSYVLRVGESGDGDSTPPAPWVNVMANPRFGTLVSEAGSGFTWVDNSGESRITGWSNDPVLDPPSEALYVRDEETGLVTSPTPGPRAGGGPVEVHHGFGWSRFRSRGEGLEMDLRLFVTRDRPVRLATLALENLWDHPRRLTVTQYVEWVMGTDRDRTAAHLITDIDRDSGALMAWNPYSPGGTGRVGILASTLPLHGATCDRMEFLGDGGLLAPDGLRRLGLARRFGRGLDPCGALQVHMDIPPRSTGTATFILGAVADPAEGRALISELRRPGAVAEELEKSTRFWEGILGRLQVKTPLPEIDLMVNGWLLYQALSCRIWGRSGLYQSSGAFGFRDQLQDVLALLGPAPHLAREHILAAARHQFPEGDVLHWWHPDSDRGVRTRCSDDLLWLPFAVANYLEATGDRGILEEPVTFLAGSPLRGDEMTRYGVYLPGEETGTLFDHCIRALRHGLRTGPQGLPLIGTGDWNDSLDSLGEEGRGESVWLAWFICDIARRWTPICDDRGAGDLAGWLRRSAEAVATAADEVAWDGAWYRRATFDDGTWVGTSAAAEGKIDSLTQSWALLSGGADPDRARTAMGSVLTHLVDSDHRLVLLLAPPFQRADPYPGYIRNYPAGVRENGGQYTHAGIWVAWALAESGDPGSAVRLLEFMNPATRLRTPEELELYQREPYAVSADIYGAPPFTGTGGWTWYTGSAAWLYRLATEAILGLHTVPGGLRIDPRIPGEWPGFEAVIRPWTANPVDGGEPRAGTVYRILVDNGNGVGMGVRRMEVDGRPTPTNRLSFEPDGRVHEVRVELGDGGVPPGPTWWGG